jgi:hypothetical protein
MIKNKKEDYVKEVEVGLCAFLHWKEMIKNKKEDYVKEALVRIIGIIGIIGIVEILEAKIVKVKTLGIKKVIVIKNIHIYILNTKLN